MRLLQLFTLTDDGIFRIIRGILGLHMVIGGTYILTPFYIASETSALSFELGTGVGLTIYALLYLIGGIGLIVTAITNNKKGSKFFLLWCFGIHLYLVSLTVVSMGLRPLGWLARLVVALIALLLRFAIRE